MKQKINLRYIKKRRLKLGLTYRDMANALGLSAPEKYYRRECGRYNFKAVELPSLANKLEISLQKIFE